MDYNKHKHKKNWNKKFSDNKNSRDNRENHEVEPEKNDVIHAENQKIEAEKSPKSNVLICPRCKQPITEMSTALAEKGSGEPVHFDCVLSYLQSTEKLMPNQKISYIGQGRFAVIYFPNIHDSRNFSIVKVIEWEERDKTYEWRAKLANLYSQIK